jgi:hypothetical protein
VVKATTTLSGNNFNALFEMLSGSGAFFTLRNPMICGTYAGEVGVMNISICFDRMYLTSSSM